MYGGKSISRNALNRRRVSGLAAVAAAFVILSKVLQVLEVNLTRSAFVSGYILIALVVFLAMFNLRKRLSFLQALGTSSQWMQLHIYSGVFSGLAFLMHVGWRIPDGSFERLLAVLFSSTFVSGCYGLFITRSFPRKLAALRTQVIFESIPMRRQDLVVSAQRLISSIAPENDTLPRLFVNRVAAFLVLPRSWQFVLTPSHRECRRLVDEMAAMDRYLSQHDREISRSLMQIVREKDDLDYHWVLQSRLKYWLFIHMGLTVSLLTAAFLHAVLAQAFGGGLR